MQSTAKKHSDPSALPEKGYVRLPQILRVIPIGKSSWWAGVRSGKYPAPVRPSPFGRVTVWRAEDINCLIATAGGAQK